MCPVPLALHRSDRAFHAYVLPRALEEVGGESYLGGACQGLAVEVQFEVAYADFLLII